MGLHLKSTRPLSSITEMSTGSTAIEKNINENLQEKENASIWTNYLAGYSVALNKFWQVILIFLRTSHA